MCDIVYFMPKKPTEKKDELISVRVKSPIKEKLLEIAIEKDRPLSWVVNQIIEEYLEKKKPKSRRNKNGI